MIREMDIGVKYNLDIVYLDDQSLDGKVLIDFQCDIGDYLELIKSYKVRGVRLGDKVNGTLILEI